MVTVKPNYIKNLYIGEKASGCEAQIRRAIARGTTIPGMFLVTYASNEIDQLDIIEGKYLLRKRVREKLPPIVGLAITKGEAYALIEQMIQDTFRATGTCEVRRYLEELEQGE